MSNVIREFYFADALYYKDIENSTEMNTDLIGKILQWRHDEPEGVQISNSLGWQSKDTMSYRDEFHQITKTINDALNEISINEEYCSKRDLVVENMWANVSQKYAYNSYHTHPGSLWSGVYYVQCPPNCGNIRFYNKDVQSTWWPEYEKKQVMARQPHQWNNVFYEPIEGRLILFPSHVGHEVPQNLTDIEGQDGYRISISFNSTQIQKEK